MLNRIVIVFQSPNYDHMANSIRNVLVGDEFTTERNVILQRCSPEMKIPEIISLMNGFDHLNFMILLGLPCQEEGFNLIESLKILHPTCKFIIGNLKLLQFEQVAILQSSIDLNPSFSDAKNLFTEQTHLTKPLSVYLGAAISMQIINPDYLKLEPNVCAQHFQQSIDVANISSNTNAQIVIIGCGQLGFSVLQNLIKIKFSNFILVDDKKVKKYHINLNRKFFTPEQIDWYKCDALKCDAICKGAKSVLTIYERIDNIDNLKWEQMKNDNSILISCVNCTISKRSINQICLIYELPFIDVGINDKMFHLEVFIPHITESYFGNNDVVEKQTELCLIKSFPRVIQHCIEWAKTKLVKKFGQRPLRVSNWEECITHSRIQFEKWFNHKPKQLIHSIPLDKTTDDQTMFWDNKKVPNAIVFDVKDNLHFTFIKQFALLTAIANDVPIGNIDDEFIIGVIDSVEVPEFIPREKYIQTEDDDNDDQVNNNHNDGGNFSYLKDNDDHLSFVYSAANLRANVYGIETVNQNHVWKISNDVNSCSMGSIEAASSLVCLEIGKIIELNGIYQNNTSTSSRNYFGNIFYPNMLTECFPKQPKITSLNNDKMRFTEWDSMVIQETKDMKLENVIELLKEQTDLECSLISDFKNKPIYLSPEFFPSHEKKKKQLMRDLILDDNSEIPKFAHLSVSFQSRDGTEDIPGPTVKFCFAQD